MNEEEKKAVKFFYNLRATIDESNMLFDEEINVKHGKETIKQITTILNLIEKLQKENEELKENCNIDYKRECEVLALQLHLLREEAKTTEKDYNMLKEYYKEKNEVNARFIPVQKIEAKIEELDIAILECEYLDDDSEEYKKEVEKDKLELLKQKSILQKLLE